MRYFPRHRHSAWGTHVDLTVDVGFLFVGVGSPGGGPAGESGGRDSPEFFYLDGLYDSVQTIAGARHRIEFEGLTNAFARISRNSKTMLSMDPHEKRAVCARLSHLKQQLYDLGCQSLAPDERQRRLWALVNEINRARTEISYAHELN